MTREPDEVSSDLMAPLEALPVFFGLDGRRVIVVGASEGAAWKADLAAATGARVEVFAVEPCAKMREIALARANITLFTRDAHEGELNGAALIFGVVEDEAKAGALREAAAAAGVPLNLADRPGMSDFIMGAIVNRSPLVIGVSTGGAAQVFAQAVRGRIETLVPASFAAWARAAKVWRPRKCLFPGLIFWRGGIFGGASPASPSPMSSARRRARTATRCLPRRGPAATAPRAGASRWSGPGRAIRSCSTLKGLRVLAGADVVLFDDLVPASVLISPAARRRASTSASAAMAPRCDRRKSPRCC